MAVLVSTEVCPWLAGCCVFEVLALCVSGGSGKKSGVCVAGAGVLQCQVVYLGPRRSGVAASSKQSGKNQNLPVWNIFN